MSADLERVIEVFEEALERDPAQRRAYVEQEAGADASLRERVLQMLDLDEQPDQRLDDLALSDRRAALEDILGSERDAQIPQSIGPFRVLRRLGRGGMGDVFEVEQSSPRRRVALKLLRHGRRPGEQRRRFHRESELLARLDHPSIAKIHEVGETSASEGATPFFVMELVDGADLRRWSEGRARRELLLTFVHICDAVDHAHQAGVVHRDLKPENVLIGADGIPKVLDFGVARVVDARLELTTMRTEAGQLIGTLAYMAPEQARGDSDAIDARTDVYALGVMLFELLAGHLPHRIQGRPVAEALRTIGEDEPSSLGSLDSSLRGDLDVIVAQALEKEPRRRYASAAALADDIRRHLTDQPIQARPPSAFYHLAKFARRHRGLTAGLALSFVAMALATAVSIRFSFSEAEQRRLAESARERAEEERGRADETAYGLSLVLARAALGGGRVEEADEILAGVPEGLRGWEWRVLASGLDRHEWSAESASELPCSGRGSSPPEPIFSRDGRYLATLESPTTVAVWRVEGGALAHRFACAASIAASGFALSADELLVGTESGDLRRYSLETGELVDRQALPGRATAVALDGSGERVAIGYSIDEATHRIEVGPLDGQRIQARAEYPSADLGFTDEGQLLVAGLAVGADASRRFLFDSHTGEQLVHLAIDSAGHRTSSERFSTAPLGRGIALGTSYQTVNIWTSRSKARVRDGIPSDQKVADPARSDVSHVAFSLDGSRLATSSEGGALRIWELPGGELTDAFRSRARASVALSPDGLRMASVSRGRLRLFDLERPSGPLVLNDGSTSIWYLRLSPDGTTLASVPRDGRIRLWDLVEERVVATLEPGQAYSNDMWMLGRLQVGWQADGVQLLTRSETQPFEGYAVLDTVSETTFEDYVACSAVEQEPRWLEHLGRVDSMRVRVFTPDAKRVLDLIHGTLTTRDGSGSQVVLEGHSPIAESPSWYNNDASFAPDAQRVAVARTRATIHEVETGLELARLPINPGLKVYAIAWSPDGRRIATGTSDGTITLWDGDDYERIADLGKHGGFAHDLEWHPDGTRLISGGADGTIFVWDSLPRAERRRLDAPVRARRAHWAPRIDQALADGQGAADLAAELRSDVSLSDQDRLAALQVLRERFHARRSH